MKASLFLVFASVLTAWGETRHQTAAGFTNEFAVLEFNAAGRISCLMDKTTGRNLLRYNSSASLLRQKGGKYLDPQRMDVRDGRLVFTWSGRKGEAVLAVRTEPWGFVFTVEKADVMEADDVEAYLPLRLWPAKELCRWVGASACAFSDPTNTVALRAYDLEVAMSTPGSVMLETSVAREFSPSGKRMALVAAPYAKARDCLKAMTLDAGVFHTKCGGAWSLDAPENRRSYLFAGVTHDSVDDWIALAERGGFGTLHFSGWWKAKGHYDPSPQRFPGGKEQLKSCIDKVRAAGIAAGTHTLCSGIDFTDPWITPECRTNLCALYTYTLSEPLAPNAQELVVDEPPGPRHDTVTTYFSNGNILRVGHELMTYTGIRAERPYAFTGLKRGAFGTRKLGLVPAGTKVDYVFQHFFTLFPDPRSDFDDEMAAHLGDLIDYYGFSLVYHDGAEPFPRYEADLNRLKFARASSRTRDNIQFEASMSNPHGWWYHSTAGALDHPTWAAKRYHQVHVESASKSVHANFWACQTGWWSPRLGNETARGHFSDEIEFFASKNAAFDLSMSVQGPGVSFGPMCFSHEDQMTILGWYERARLARAFTPEAVEMMRGKGEETRLRQGATGEWTIRPVKCSVHRVASKSFREWKALMPKSESAALRVEALYGAAPYDASDGKSLIGAGDLKEMKFATAGKDVVQRVEVGQDDVHGTTLRVAVENRRPSPRGAWSRISLEYPRQYRNVAPPGKEGGAFGFWVKGDGSGAVLNLQLQTPAKYVGGLSDHVVKLDFTGWRYVQLFVRERDVETWLDHSWPYSGFYQIFRQRLDLGRIEHVSIYLNEVPARGKTEVELSQVRVLPQKQLSFKDVCVCVNGERFELPFGLDSGDYAELEGGVWTRYSYRGDPLSRGVAKEVELCAGTNEFTFAAMSDGGDPRAEVTVFAIGGGVPAFKRSTMDDAQMAYEAMRPQWFEPSNGFTSVEHIVARPGGAANIEIEMLGRVHDPAIVFPGGRRFPFGVDVEDGQRFVCRDGRSWKVFDGKRKIVKEGVFGMAMPQLRGGTARFEASSDSAARISIVKRYGAHRSSKAESVVEGSAKVAANDELADVAKATYRAWTFDEGSGASSREVGSRARDASLSPAVRWVTGPFGTALAFVDASARAEMPAMGDVAAGGEWTVSAWVRAAAENKSVSPWTLEGETAVRDLTPEKWRFVAVKGRGPIPAFALGTDGVRPFSGFVDDLRIYARHLSAADMERLGSNPKYIDIEGWQDDGTGGVVPTVISPPCSSKPQGAKAP